MSSRRGGDAEGGPKSELLDDLLFLPITRGYMQINQAKNGDVDLEDVFKLIEICLYEDDLKRQEIRKQNERLNNGK